MNFRAKVALVTGAAGGIGQSLCEALAKRGAVVWAWDKHHLEEMRVKAKKEGWEFFAEEVDVTQAKAVEAASARILKKHGAIDFWFNNAGIAGLGGFLDTSAEDFSRVLHVNLDGVVTGTRVALREMEVRGRGTIINMASVAGHLAAPYMTAYCATKHAVVGFTRALSQELKLRDSPVRLCLVSPGFVDTGLIARGQRLGFPDWLSWALSTPDKVTDEILRALERGQTEVYPTWNGRLLLKASRVFPRTTVRASRLLLVRNWRDLLLNRYVVD